MKTMNHFVLSTFTAIIFSTIVQASGDGISNPGAAANQLEQAEGLTNVMHINEDSSRTIVHINGDAARLLYEKLPSIRENIKGAGALECVSLNNDSKVRCALVISEGKYLMTRESSTDLGPSMYNLPPRYTE